MKPPPLIFSLLLIPNILHHNTFKVLLDPAITSCKSVINEPAVNKPWGITLPYIKNTQG